MNDPTNPPSTGEPNASVNSGTSTQNVDPSATIQVQNKQPVEPKTKNKEPSGTDDEKPNPFAHWRTALQATVALGCIAVGIDIARHSSTWWHRLAALVFFMASTAASIQLLLRFEEYRRKSREKIRAKLEERESSNFSDLPTPAQELIRHLRARYDESAALHARSLRSSPLLFTCGVISAIGSVTFLSAGVLYAIRNEAAGIDKWVRITTLIETGTSAILLGVMATGFFSWRRDIHRHALTFFGDMIHTRSIQTAIRLIASMQGWIGDKPDEKTYLRLIKSVSIRAIAPGQSEPDAPPQSLSPNLIEKSIDTAKTLITQVSASIKGAPKDN